MTCGVLCMPAPPATGESDLVPEVPVFVPRPRRLDAQERDVDHEEAEQHVVQIKVLLRHVVFTVRFAHATDHRDANGT